MRGKEHKMNLNETLIKTYEELCEKSQKDREKCIISTGFKDLDYYIGGSFNTPNLITVSAVSGMGKTTFVTNIAFNVAKKYPNIDVVFFSFQKNGTQIATKILSAETQLSTYKFENALLDTNDWINIAYCTENLSKISNLHIIDDLSNMNIEQMKDSLKELKNIGLIVIDNLQLMATGFSVAEIIRQIKIISQEFGVPIIIVSQLSQIENRADKHPNITDLKVIENVDIYSDVIIFLYRNSYYNIASEEKNICECIVSKNNNGEIGIFKLDKFTNLETIEI